jgi:hypothetical protein
MLGCIIGTLGALLSLSSAQAADSAPKRVFMCMYDGGSDAFTWQWTGEKSVPPAGAPVCLISDGDGFHCDQVKDSKGHLLGDGSPGFERFCGTDSTSSGDYPDLKVYEQ